MNRVCSQRGDYQLYQSRHTNFKGKEIEVAKNHRTMVFGGFFSCMEKENLCVFMPRWCRRDEVTGVEKIGDGWLWYKKIRHYRKDEKLYYRWFLFYGYFGKIKVTYPNWIDIIENDCGIEKNLINKCGEGLL